MSIPVAATLGEHFFWLTSRAAGTAALILSSVSVAAGLAMGGRLLKRRGPDLRSTSASPASTRPASSRA